MRLYLSNVDMLVHHVSFKFRTCLMAAVPQVWTEVLGSVGIVRGEVLWVGWKRVKRGVCCYTIQELQTRITTYHIARREATLYVICLRWGRGYAVQFVRLGAKVCSLWGGGCVWGLLQMPALQTPAGWVCQCSACEQWGIRTVSSARGVSRFLIE